MTSILTEAAQAAHHVAVSLLSVAQISPGASIPATHSVKEERPDNSVTISNLKGVNIFVGVPGAFTPTCSSQVPGYIENYDKFKAKGVNEIYVVTVNDAFVVEAWKKSLAPNGTHIRFIADDKASFAGALGLLFDASPFLGGPRSKRFVIIADDSTVRSIAVEEDPGVSTITTAETILAQI